ncbi:MAG TPA: IS21-like element helper ATPase IstB [Paenisporosarcina sp.]|nr:IS21-like element helper ATPase IstB [Paenisporosarcina sp.]
MSDFLLARAKNLKLHGMIAHWDSIENADWVPKLLDWEESERAYRGVATRLQKAHLGEFKLLAEFDWDWPKKCDRVAIEDLMGLSFAESHTNIIICGSNGAGKTMIAQNIAYQAVLSGYNTLFTTAGLMLNELTAQDGTNALRRRIQHYVKPKILVIDEVGYLSYSNRHADLMFEVISRRYQTSSTIVTTNKTFAEWGEIFPNASCVVSLIDRLVHNSEIIDIDADSYRMKEAKEKTLKRKEERSKKKSKPT